MIFFVFIVDEYLVVAKDKFGYAIEQVSEYRYAVLPCPLHSCCCFVVVVATPQALGMLFWYEYNIDKALENMPNFCPLKG